MFPFIRQPLHDRMLMVPGIQHILMLLAMRATHARRAILYQLTIAPIYIGSRFLIPVLPTAQGTNLIVFRPVHEGVISGMIDHDTTTSLHIFQETTVCLFRPSIPIIIQHHQLVRTKIQDKAGHILPRLRRDREIHGEASRVLQYLFKHHVAHLPIMVILPRY